MLIYLFDVRDTDQPGVCRFDRECFLWWRFRFNLYEKVGGKWFNTGNIRDKRFNFEPEFTAKILKRNYRIFEVPISFNPRDYAQGKKIKLKDAFEAVWTLLRFRIWD